MAAPRPASPPSAPSLPQGSGPVTVRALGADGDGLADLPGGATLYLPRTLPGERVQPGPVAKRGPAWAADPAAILSPSPDRATPPCPLFTSCGGCALQHMADHAYAAWKLGLVQDVLRRLGSTAALPPLARTPPASRRRIELAIARRGGAVQLGLHARRSDAIVDMTTCPILHPSLLALVQSLRTVLPRLQALRRAGTALINLLDTGPDLLLRTDAPLTAADRIALTALATREDLPRISWSQGPRAPIEPACILRPATTAFAGHATPIPPGAFLQASREGESAIQAAVTSALPPLKPRSRLIELYAGCGTLTHALATRARVQAYEGDPVALAAIRAAANPAVSTTLRDLARQPLQSAELKGAAAIVLDPPWSGALPQMPALAASGLPVIYVSCNPQALLRDGRVLTQAGYRVASAQAIDQFLWSARIESVVAFTRP